MIDTQKRTYVDVPYKTRLGRTLEWRVQNPASKQVAMDIAVAEVKSFGAGNKIIAKTSQLKIKRHPVFSSRVLRPA